MCITVGNVVVRRSYGGDIFFVVVDIHNDVAQLRGIFQRLAADAPLDDLIHVLDTEIIRNKLFDHLQDMYTLRMSSAIFR